MKKLEINKENIEKTINKMEGQTIMFIIIGVIIMFFKIPFYCFFILAICWIGLIYLLKSELNQK